MWQPKQSARKSFEVVLAGSAASNQDQPQPSPQSLFPENRPTLSFTMTNQPARVPALLTVPVVIMHSRSDETISAPAQRASSAAPYRQTERPRGVRLSQARARPG